MQTAVAWRIPVRKMEEGRYSGSQIAGHTNPRDAGHFVFPDSKTQFCISQFSF